MARPLTKCKKTGEVYARPAAIETNIDGALGQDLPELHRRCQVTDRLSPDYLTSECLVHLIRDACRRVDQGVLGVVVPVLLTRCDAMLRSKIRDSSRPNAAELREEILQEFAVFLAGADSGEDPGELDFFECRFNLAFRAFWIDIWRREREWSQGRLPLPDESVPPDEEIATRIEEALQSPATQDENLCLGELKEAINALPAEERAALSLRILGYTKATIATMCGVSERTIHSRLKRAAARLSRFKQEGR